MKNFYKMLHLDSADASLADIQKQCQTIKQNGELPLEHIKKIYAVLSNPEQRTRYNTALRQAEPDFFQAAQPISTTQPEPTNTSTENFYRLLQLNSADVDERTIRKHLQTALSRNQISLETAQQIRDTLLNMGKRSVYNQTLRQSEPDFFRAPQTIAINDDDTEAQYRPQKSPKPTAEKGQWIVDNQARNIFLGLFALALISWLLPWIKVLDLTFAGYKLSLLNPIFLMWCAFLVVRANLKNEALKYTQLLLPLGLMVGNHIRFVIRIKSKFSNEFLTLSQFSYGYGFYLQIAAIVGICAYLFICYQKNQHN